MRSYAFVDKTTGLIRGICSWGDDRDFPTDAVIDESEEVITIEDSDNSPVKYDNHKYNKKKKKFIEFVPEPVVLVPYIDPEILALKEELAIMKAELATKVSI